MKIIFNILGRWKIIFAFAFIYLCTYAPVYGSDWPQFLLNPQHTSYNTTENQLSSTTINSIIQGWNFNLNSSTSPIIVNGLVYITSSNNGTTATLYALRETDGSMVWSVSIPNVVNSTPVVSNGIIYIISFNGGNIYAYNATNGTPVWNSSLGTITESSPVVANNVLYVGSGDNRVHAFNATTGIPIWTSNTFGYISSSPAISNGILYIGANDNKLHALETNTGAQLWSSVTGGPITSSPTVANGKVYVGSSDSKVYAFDSNNGSLIWNTQTISGSSITASPSVANGIVYIGNGANTSNNKFYAIDGSTGNILWQIPIGGNIFSTAAIANGLLYFGGTDGKLYIVNSTTGTVVKTINTGSSITLSPAVVNSSIYFANGIRLYDYRLPNNSPIINSIPPSSISEGGTFSYSGSFSDSDSSSWTGTVDYGDGSGIQGLELGGSGTNFTLSHVYQQNGSYTVTVSITDNQGATTTQTTTVTVNNVPPTITSVSSPNNPIEPETNADITANFTDPGTSDSFTSTINWGDGSSSNGTITLESPTDSVTGTHTYTSPGTYNVTLTVTDDNGASTSSTTQIVVNAPPTAQANGPYTVNEGSSVTLNGTGTDPDGDTLTYAWDLDNNGTYETLGQSVSFQGIDGPATKTVGFQVCDTFGACTTDTTTVTVTNVNPTVNAITVSPSQPQENQAITATANFTDPGVLDTHTASWNWGDSNITTGTVTESNGSGSVSDTHIYTSYGTYTLTLTLTDKDGGVASQTKQIFVNAPPVANAGGSYTMNEGDTILLNGSATDPDGDSLTYSWDLDNSGTYSLTGQTALFSAPDGPTTKTVNLKVCDDKGACDISSTNITINNVNPTITSLNFPQSPVTLGTAIAVTGTFTDPGILDTHTAVWDWGDGNTQQATISESNGNGSASGNHTYTSAGVYTASITVTDKDSGIVSQQYQYVVVYDPTAGFVTGGGTITSPVGADVFNASATGKASFGISAKYQSGETIPTGSTGFTFSNGNLVFASTSYDWLVVSGNKAYLHGTGTINGTGSYNFLMSVIDGNPDTLRIKIKDNSTNTVIYDNQMNASDFTDPTEVISSGQIKIH